MQNRRLQQELMDDPQLDAHVHRTALQGLGRVNWCSRTDTMIWNALVTSSVLERPQRTPNTLRILDIASGGGDLTLRLANRSRRAGWDVDIEGCDISPTAVDFAASQAATAAIGNVRYFQHDVLTQPLPERSYDVVMCSLFLHHLEESQARQLLKIMSSTARQLVLVDDLRRTRRGYLLAFFGSRLLSRCYVVHNDGPMSVESAFTSDESRVMAEEAGLRDITVKFHWPQRYLLMGRPAA